MGVEIDSKANLNQSISQNASFKLMYTSNNKALLFDRVLWANYSMREMEIGVANAAHALIRLSGFIHADAMVKSIDAMLDRHPVLNSIVELSDGNLYIVRRPKKAPEYKELFADGETSENREKEAMRIAKDMVYKEYDLDKRAAHDRTLLRIANRNWIVC